MRRLVAQLFATFALGLIATGLLLGFLPGGDCGAAFSGGSAYSDSGGCATSRAERRALPVALLGLGVTAGIAAATIPMPGKTEPEDRSSDG
jgi:hypothetical protein